MSVPPGSMSDQQEKPARHAGNLRIGDLVVCRLGYGAMRITGDGTWGPPRDRENAKKVLRSAVANAEQNPGIIEENLVVKGGWVDEGPTLKRYRPRAYGRATQIRKRTSHITVVVENVGEEFSGA